MIVRWISRSRKEALTEFSMATKTVYYKVLQIFDGRRWLDVPTVSGDCEDSMFPAKAEDEKQLADSEQSALIEPEMIAGNPETRNADNSEEG